MKNILAIDIKRAFSKKMGLAILFGIIIHLFSIYNWDSWLIGFPQNFIEFADDPERLAIAKQMYMQGLNSYILWFHSVDVYTVFMPLIACLVYSDSMLLDKKTKFINNIITRLDRKKYILSRVIVNGLVGAITVALPTLLVYITLKIFFNNNIYDFQVYPVGALSNLFKSSPDKYIIFYIIIESIFGFVYATLALATSFFNEKRLIAIITPFIFWHIGTFIFEQLHIFELSPAIGNAFLVRTNSSVIGIVIQLLILLIIGLLAIKKGSKELV